MENSYVTVWDHEVNALSSVDVIKSVADGIVTLEDGTQWDADDGRYLGCDKWLRIRMAYPTEALQWRHELQKTRGAS